jgi:hypothetical protein
VRRATLIAAVAFAASLAPLALAPAAAQAGFGFRAGAAGFEVTALAEDGAPDTLAGSHPYALSVKASFNPGPQRAGEPGVAATDGDLRDLRIEEPAGLIENPDALPKCTQAQFHTPRSSPFEASLSGENCPAYTQVGVVTLHTSYGGGSTRSFGVFNLAPPPGVPSQLGFAPYGMPITLDSRIRQAQGEYGLTLETHNFPQVFDLYGLELTIWGTPWGVSHNGQRGNCLNESEPSFPWAKCSVGPPVADPPLAYLSLPTTCGVPLSFAASADSWQEPTAVSAKYEAPALEECETLLFDPRPVGQLADRRASSPSGYEFALNNDNEALTIPNFRVQSQVRKAVITLPQGLTINPSVGAGLGYCTPAQYAAETAFSPPGAACPNDSKIGDFTVQSPLFEETLGGAIFLAQPDDPATAAPGAENPFDTLLALYLVAKAPQRGILVKVAGKVELDPTSGRLTATFDDLPQLPYTNLRVHFREGQRAPLVTPPACGSATTHTELTPWLGALAAVGSSFESVIEAGIGGGPCPAGTPPFSPGTRGGTLNSNAGSYTPFYLHLTRSDAEQEITSYSAKLPPGLLGKIAGIPYCPEAAIAAAKAETGTEELEHPSCPAGSEIGHTTSGYGVGSTLAYAPGRLYLAGPYHGSSFSVVAIDSALVGPFDLGVVIVRSAIEVDPRNAQVSIDSAGSDPIPHIIDGIPIHLRDVRVYISRHELTINPTSCEPFSLSSTLTGSAEPFANPRDIEATATVPFQVANCASLGFAPKLSFKLKGGTKRGDYPSLRALYRPRPSDANISSATVTLPPSLFLAQSRIRTICTRVQLAAEACPGGAVYGHARAVTPLLAAPLEGPVYLVSSSNVLPDLLVALHGQGITVELEGRIDSSHGGIRARFEALPDAPVAEFSLTMNGGKRGVLVDSAANLCASDQLATVRLAGQNNKGEAFSSKLQANCREHRRHRR